MTENRRLRFRVRTMLVAVLIISLALIVTLQQLQVRRQRAEIERLQKRLDLDQVLLDQLTQMIRVQRDLIERQRTPNPSSSQP
jgi:hypothetical protein